MTFVSGVNLNLKLIVESEWEIKWLPCLERIWSVSDSWNLDKYQDGIRIWCVSELYMKVEFLNEYQDGIRIWCVSELYLKVEFEWVSGWNSYLERIWTISESWIWMSIRMSSVSGVYLNCIWKLNLNEYQDGIRVWSVYELYQKLKSERVS